MTGIKTFLRTVRRNRWQRDQFPKWISAPDQPWKALGDVIPGKLHDDDFPDDTDKIRSALSLWLIDEEQSNLPRILAALASTRDSLKNIDYLLIPSTVLDKGLEPTKTTGHSNDDVANESWHYDIQGITAVGACRLASIVVSEVDGGRAQLKRAQLPEVANHLRKSIEDEHLDREMLNERVVKRLDATPQGSTRE